MSITDEEYQKAIDAIHDEGCDIAVADDNKFLVIISLPPKRLPVKINKGTGVIPEDGWKEVRHQFTLNLGAGLQSIQKILHANGLTDVYLVQTKEEVPTTFTTLENPNAGQKKNVTPEGFSAVPKAAVARGVKNGK